MSTYNISYVCRMTEEIGEIRAKIMRLIDQIYRFDPNHAIFEKDNFKPISNALF